ncbi:MAG: AmmeMemoRadiSam system protein B [Candidatus Woesearchaeota archaeon]
MRKPKLTGMYYASAPTLINQELEQAFQSKKGPGDLPADLDPKHKINGLIVPRFRYKESAPSSAWAYKVLAESKKPDVIIILGQSEEEPAITQEPWETPYGIVRVDQKLVRSILEKGHIKENNALFDDDEYIESQLPLLQFIYKNKQPQILPILLNASLNLRELSTDIKEALLDQNKTAVIIVPTNLTSHGAIHRYLPFSTNINKKVYELDRDAIEVIKKNNPKKYLEFVEEHGMNTNNVLGIVMLMLLTKSNYELEQYYTLADITNDEKDVVSFASLIAK